MKVGPWTKIEAGIADILPGAKTLTLAGGLAAFNILDFVQQTYQVFMPGLEHLIPAPYMAIVNVVVPGLIMWLRNISGRTEERVEKLTAVEMPVTDETPTQA